MVEHQKAPRNGDAIIGRLSAPAFEVATFRHWRAGGILGVSGVYLMHIIAAVKPWAS